MASKPRFFTASKKGENYELRAGLNSQYADQRKDSIKRVIANMTVGKDVSGLFPDVLKNMQSEDLEQKKLVYLYLMNYAKSHPDLVILAVNTFVKDAEDPNPLIRALAIRTMGCLRADKILDYVCDPLRKSLQDENPYVRKTATIGVAKLYDLKPNLALENGFIDQLKEMVADSNPMVVANAVTALTEIHESAIANDPSDGVFILDSAVIQKLLVALGECTEWGRIALLGAIARYKSTDQKDAEQICERVVPQFQHANASVVLAAIKVIMIHVREIRREEFIKQIMRKMAPPLVTLVSSAPEVQWVALRNINLILQRRPDVLQNEMRVFFCKYNDPAYVKVEKLDIMVKLVTEKTVDTLLSELKEYASEVDVEFVRKAVRAIGQCAIKIEEAAERCVNVLLDLISTRVTYVVQEAIIVIKDIFRKYPSQYEGIIPTLCSNLDDLDEPESKASLIWILGDYAEKIDNAEEILSTFLETFADDPFPVQLQTLTGIVKLFLKKPDGAQGLVQRVLSLATKNSDSPDIRDRAYIYWRLLSTDPEATKSVVLKARPTISLESTSVSSVLLEELIDEISTLASVYHRPAETFIGRGRLGADEVQRKANEREEDLSRERAIAAVVQGQHAENLLDFDDDMGNDGLKPNGLGSLVGTDSPSSISNSNSLSNNLPTASSGLDDLMGLFDSNPIGQASGSNNSNGNLNSSISTQNQPHISQNAMIDDMFDGLI
ncbi:adaptin N terminal region-domain-containing protein [Phakopsora pachyrhizi]|uniref:AP complex subunit beta n=1 Tax=Phakopsora pachyrhizi TaxID=170000 RepID=A0AAV0AIW8_PHAPC|nr:adaptin N terminal region-domain-containing protein [Phakopsora pachyrhizi]CAH7668396.1 adaptin N terminal region-domain-containing protein [Phakopsora pachyrhizi]